MSYKTKVKIAIGVAAVIIVVLVIGMGLFVNNNKDSVSNDSTNSQTSEGYSSLSDALKNVISIGITTNSEGTKLVKILNDFTSEDIVSLGSKSYSFADYCYSNGDIYTLYQKNNNLQIYYVDLLTNKETLILNIESSYLDSFEYYDGDIYFITNGQSVYKDDVYYTTTANTIVRYDLSTQEQQQIKDVDTTERIVSSKIDSQNGVIYYMKNIYNSATTICTATVCKFNVTTGEEENVLQAEAEGQEILFDEDGYLICKLKSGDESLHYVYDIANGSVWDLGSISLTYDDADSYIAFSQNYIAFSNGESIKLFDYEGNVINSSLYSVESENKIYSIEMLSDNILEIRISAYNNVYENNITATYLIDFENSTIQEISNNYYDTITIN